MFTGSLSLGQAISNQILYLNQWQLITATFNSTDFCLYLNGTLTADLSKILTPTKIVRSNCYIGKSNWPDGYSSSYLDDLRFYNKSLTQKEILDLMPSIYTSEN